MVLDDESPKDVLTLINMAMSITDDPKRFLKFCYIIFSAQGKDSWCAEAEQHLRDKDFMKKVGFLGAVKENSENRLMYYGNDKGFNDPLRYREDDELEVTDVEIRFLRYLGIIIKELQEDEGLVI